MTYSNFKFYLRPHAASETPKPNPASSADVAGGKDSRTWEHDRQRTRRAADFVKMRTRKSQWAPRSDNAKRASGARYSLDGDEACEDVPAAVPLEDTRDAKYAELDALGDSRLEVPLAALVTSRKSRKGKGLGDFEFVPSVRSVIALDDNVIPDLDVEEPWEHVYGDDNEDFPSVSKGPSYAAVASLS